MTQYVVTPHRSRMRRTVDIFANRPVLTASICVGLGLWLALMLWPNDLRWSTRAIFAWDAGALWMTVAMMRKMHGCTVEHIQFMADKQDEGQGFILGLVLVACIASLAAIGAELNLAKDEHGLLKSGRVALAALTVAASWFITQLIFALHYAHEFYSSDGDGGRAGGLNFPGNEAPDYWDFLHFSVVIGAAAQTADISFTSKPMRRTGTMHSLIAFTFNTVVLALSINLLASVV
jgi:uncharacterized membrane protein